MFYFGYLTLPLLAVFLNFKIGGFKEATKKLQCMNEFQLIIAG
jgi:hypothetical protein